MTRWTASQFKNELDVLEIRLGTIGHMVDHIVLAEATVDQRGRPKELVFPQHRERFAPWLDKIRYVVVDDMPTGDTHEDDVSRERFQRDALIRGMWGLAPDDVVYVSDLDEIPHPTALEEGFANPPMRFAMDMHVYRLNWRWLDRGCRIGTLGAVVTGRSILDRGVCHAVLWDRSVVSRPGISGWHLTYQGDIATIRDKITGMMDKFYEQLVPPELKRDEDLGNGYMRLAMPPEAFLRDAWINRSITTGKDIFGREYRPTEWVDVDQLPLYVLENIDRFKHMLIERPPWQDAVESRPRCTCGAIYVGDVLHHFPYCALAEVEGTPLYDADHRHLRRNA